MSIPVPNTPVRPQFHAAEHGLGLMHARAAQATPRKRVLVVDDDLDGALTLSLLLRELGYTVVTTDNGVDALGWGARLHPEVVLLDLAMPGMNGFELCRTIRELEWGARAKVIAITGLNHSSDKERSRAAGFDMHLVKPVDLQVLYRELLSPAAP